MSKTLGYIKNKGTLLGAIIIASVVGGATTAIVMAAIPDSSGTIHGCYRSGLLGNGSLRVIDSPSASCNGNETSLNWSQSPGVKSSNNTITANLGDIPITSPQTLLTLPNIGELQVYCDTTNQGLKYHNTTASNAFIGAGNNDSIVTPGSSATVGMQDIISSGSGSSVHMASYTIKWDAAGGDLNKCWFRGQALTSS